MGCRCSKPLDSVPQSPLQQLQQEQLHRMQQRLQAHRRPDEKRQRKLAQLQKRNAKKRRKQRSGSYGDGSGAGPCGIVGLAPQLRLLGGSNGSTATESPFALLTRTAEQQCAEQQLHIEQKTEQQLEHELHTFVLNQLLLIIQFFGHFELELAALDEELQAKRRDCAQRLTDQTLLFANAIDAAVAKRITFKAVHGTNKHLIQPLQVPIMYVVFENIDIARPNDANYDSIATLCKVLMETDYYATTPCRAQYTQMLEQSRWKGYVRLKLREAAKMQQQAISSADEGVYTDGSSGYSTATSIYGQLAMHSRLSVKANEEGDYDYVHIARLNTHRPIAELKLERTMLENNMLPETCVSRLSSYVEPWVEDTDDEEEPNEDISENEHDDDAADDDDYDEIKAQDVASKLEQLSKQEDYETVQVMRQCRVDQERRRNLLQQSYLNSSQFMNYFGDLLRQQLAPQLRIPHSQLAAGTYRGCTIYTAAGEIVPAIHVPNGWPDCAFEFNLRARPLQWPTAEMRKRMQSFGFHVVPVGYAPKRNRNPFRELEWRIVFPQAEQFLERQLTCSQLKLFMILKALVKTFVEPHEKGKAMSYTVQHLRAHLFWECERSQHCWSEHFLGEILVRFISSFAACLAKKELPDYFIARRNLFEHVAEDTLMALRSIMTDIAEQPLMHVLLAMRNLEHAADFYPKLNYRRLYDSMVTQDYLQLRSWSKYTRTQLPNSMEMEGTEAQLNSGANDAQGLLGIRQHQERTRGKLRRKTQMLRAQQQQQQQKLAEQRRDSVDSMDMELLLAMRKLSRNNNNSMSTPLNNGLEILRRTNLLELLLDHLLTLIAKANEFQNLQHAQLYLEQAQRLCLLYKKLGCAHNAQDYVQALCEAARNIELKRDAADLCVISRLAAASKESTPPALPRRISASPTHSVASQRRSLKSLKFVEHAVEVHAGDVCVLQQPYRHTPSSSILRATTEFIDQAQMDIKLEATEGETKQENVNKIESNSNLCTLLHRLKVDKMRLKTFSVKTEQILQTLTTEQQRAELRDMVNRNTEKLRTTFNHSAAS